ncbi:hypothetical protein PMI15_00504 [Polaromonas sp. CF318]|uniref:hypothetical protein n=1 Tax=Polaromonas sp. CF318 TaxID=1144318 RepID=UPI0002713CA3|nr:hypothetical protein [Polaromonas sp. CF318]EJL89675.1 hypothetical protein PMI15_00504 [Polaromonas sp. CF318]
MFLIASHQQQARAFLARPGFCLLAGAGLLGGCAVFIGVSPVFLAAAAIPLIELQLCHGAALRLPTRWWLAAGVTALVAHAMLLALIQGGATGAEKLAVNLQYVGAVLLGVGLGALFFRGSIPGAHEQERG